MGDTQTQREPHVNTKAASGVILQQARDWWETWNLEGGLEETLKASRRNQPSTNISMSNLWPLELWENKFQ
jgi:hypothetical protein